MFINYLLTYCLLIVVISIASKGNIVADLFASEPLKVFLILFVWLGAKLSKFVALNIWQSKSIELSSILCACYYFYVYCVFSDGYIAGWAASETFVDKALSAILVSLMFFVTLLVPFVFYVVARIQCNVLKMIYRI